MKLNDIAQYSLKNLGHRKLRSWLTILGIVIGIASIVTLISISEGVNEEINNQLKGFGADIIEVVPVNIESSGFSGGPGIQPTSGMLTENDFKKLDRIAGISGITKLIMERKEVSFKDKSITANIYGAEPEFFEQFGVLEIESGRFLSASDSKSVVLGSRLADEGFGKYKINVNNIVYVGGDKYRVVGIMKKSGNPFLQQMDNAVIIPFTNARDSFTTIPKNSLSVIFGRSKTGFDVEEVGGEVTEELLKAHKVNEDEKDFSVITPSFLNNTIGSITGILTVFLAAISGISLVVGGVGIANSMFTSVIERTKEIGILKSVGAKNSDILSIFLFESGLIGIVGGAIGIIIAVILLTIAKSLGAPVLIKTELVVFAVMFSAIIGLVSGAIPSKRAANLSPVDALRYE